MFGSTYSKRFASVCNTCVHFFLGVFLFLVSLAYMSVSWPIVLYRWIITKGMTPFYPKDIAQAVNLEGAAMATEFLQSKSHLPPRTSIVLNIVIEGTVPVQSIISAVDSQWIHAKDSKGQLKYPELQQYIEEWMGFMFFKKDKNFSLENHIYLRKIPSASSYQDSEQFASKLMEDLLNIPYTQHRSPWELHVIHNYKSKELIQKTKEVYTTLLLFRAHHALMDGVSILNLFVQGLFKTPVLNFESTHVKRQQGMLAQLRNLTLPLNFFKDLGYAFSPTIINEHSPFYIEDRDKSWRQIVETSQLYPLEKIKTIRKRFNVSFTSVLMTGYVAAATHFIGMKGKRTSTFNVALLFPLPNHPDKLVNHLSSTCLSVDTSPNENVIKKLKQCHGKIVQAMNSTIPLFVVPYSLKVASFNLASLVSHFTHVRFLSSAISSVPGPTQVLFFNGKRILTAHVAVGCASGVVGLALQTLSYDHSIRLAVVAENALMNRQQLKKFVARMCEEIDTIYEIAMETSKENENATVGKR